MQFIATPNTIPRTGETWIPKGQKIHISTVHIFDIKRIRKYVPEEFDIVSVFPGKTLGSIFLSSYGPGSTLEYDEFVVSPALVSYKGKKGYWVTHMYANNEKAVIGGQRLGWPKEMAEFDWPGEIPGKAVVSKNGRRICTVQYNKPLGSLGFWVKFSCPSLLDDKVFCHQFRFKADWGLCKLRLDVPDNSPIAEIYRCGKQLAAIGGTDMTGFQAENAQVLGFIPYRAKE